MSVAAVSYVVTVYNKAAFLPGVLAALKQEHAATGGEIVLVDDGSTDNSPMILAEFTAANPAVTLITQANAGVAVATNTAIARATCPYLRLVDGDDVLVPGSTMLLQQALQTTGCDFAFGRFAHDLNGSYTGPVCIVDDPLRLMLKKQPFIPSTTLGLTSVVKQALPLPLGFHTAQDFSLGLRLAKLTRFAEIPDICCLSPVESGGLSSSKARMFRDTVLLTLQLGEEQGWSPAYRRLAIGRNAGRARNYLRRHVAGARGAKIAVSLLAVAARVPFFWPYRQIMTYIANAYAAPLAAVENHP